jgi:hypothetical protein
MLAGLPASDVWDAADGGDVSLWRQSLYWVTEQQHYSCSPSLKPNTDDNRLPHITVWEFIGVAQSRELLGHVRANAAVLSCGWPPPDGRDGRQSDTLAASFFTESRGRRAVWGRRRRVRILYQHTLLVRIWF